MDAAAAKNNPELKSALAALNVSNADVLGARAAYLPTLGLNVTYGIDANEFAVNGPMIPYRLAGAQPGLLGELDGESSRCGTGYPPSTR